MSVCRCDRFFICDTKEKTITFLDMNKSIVARSNKPNNAKSEGVKCQFYSLI
jgi:hypothetical protein